MKGDLFVNFSRMICVVQYFRLDIINLDMNNRLFMIDLFAYRFLTFPFIDFRCLFWNIFQFNNLFSLKMGKTSWVKFLFSYWVKFTSFKLFKD